MALIRCPECGHEISDKALSCPHCGVTIHVCRECGQVLVGSQDVCPNCGYRNAVKTPVPQTWEEGTVTENDNTTDPIERWLKENPGERKWLSAGVASALAFITLIGGIGILLCIYFLIEKPFETLQESVGELEIIEMVFNFKIYTRNVWILAACACIVFLAGAVANLYASLWPIRCGKWLRSRNIDIREALKSESHEFQSGTFTGFKEIYGYKIQNLSRAYVYDMVLRNENSYLTIGLTFVRCMSLFLLESAFVLLYAFKVCDMIEKNAVLGMQITVFNKDAFLEFLPWFGGIIGVFFLIIIIILVISAQAGKRIAQNFYQVLSKD